MPPSLIRLYLTLCLVVLTSAQTTKPPPSPCPDVFRYVYEPTSASWYGVITIVPPARFSDVQLAVRLDLPYYRPDAGVGRIEILGGNNQVQQISNKAARGERQKLEYLVIFPPFPQIPKVAGVTFNLKNFCPRKQTYSDTRGTIELKYTLKSGLQIPISHGNEFSVFTQQTTQQPTYIPNQPANGEVIYVVETPSGNQYVIPGSMLTSKKPETVTRVTVPELVTRPTVPEPVTGPTTPEPAIRPTTTTTLDPNEEYLQLIGGATPANIETESPSTLPPTPRPKPSRKPPRKPTTPTTASPDYPEYPEPIEEDVSGHYKADSLNCGIPHSANLLVLNGEDTEKGRWPWQAAMFKQSNTGLTFQCGGALITQRHVITAAHCVFERSKKKAVEADTILIYLGKHNLRSWTEEGQQAKNVDRVIVHPKYGTRNHDFDAALLLLSDSATITDYVKPVCLWDKTSSLDSVINVQGSVLGWGRDEKGEMANRLKLAKMPVVSQETCLRSDTFYSVFTSDNTFCAGFRNGTSVCNGDSGGGMYFYLQNPKQRTKTWYTRGIVSVSRLEAAEQVCDALSYVVFTDIAKILPWIRSQLRPPSS